MNRQPNLFSDENGQAMVEYSIIIALIAIVCIAVISTFGDKVKSLIDNASLFNALNSNPEGAGAGGCH